MAMPRIFSPIINIFVFILTASYASAYLIPTPGVSAARPQLQQWSREQKYYQIHPMYDETKCLDVRQSGYKDGTPVDIFECNGTPAQNWSLQPGTTKVKVAGKNFCLDAGKAPTNGTKLKIWTCYPNLPAQTWYYTDDKRISLKDSGFCMDLTGGSNENYNPVQVWKCTNGNANQIWTV
ncbi:CAZyme family CBM13 [Agaricus bisporus var. burnettii]|uniref:CAZyme family CBM13 n=1 Tax=Agaricus bisporus var. burnettii TaxID=192524 RepID=A0A8H7EWD0_AGABI|nr:CAZyme family CBM13 [Agaricus bisporus var. burnettii]